MDASRSQLRQLFSYIFSLLKLRQFQVGKRKIALYILDLILLISNKGDSTVTSYWTLSLTV